MWKESIICLAGMLGVIMKAPPLFFLLFPPSFLLLWNFPLKGFMEFSIERISMSIERKTLLNQQHKAIKVDNKSFKF